MIATDPTTLGAEFHAWIVGISNGVPSEVADLSARHFPAWAALQGLPWEQEHQPFIWTTAETRPAYWIPRADEAITEAVRRQYMTDPRERQAVGTMMRRALARLRIA